MLRLLCVTAHPDDEAGSMGGALLLGHDRGIETYVVCLTSGEAATHRGGAKDNSELSEMRRGEFAASCAYLGVRRGEVLSYPDGKLDQQNPFEVARELAERIREIRPHVVVTFGPEGSVTAHTDHGMASVFTALAYQWAGRTNRFPEQISAGLQPWRAQKLYYTTTEFAVPERQPISPPPASALVDVGPERVQRRLEAFKKHASQSPLFELFESYMRRRGPVDRFHLAACSKPSVAKMETDLFEGIIE